jgi:predicted metal-dependent HD superfamily phosphohydrolase
MMDPHKVSDFTLQEPIKWSEELLALAQITPAAKRELRNHYSQHDRLYHGMFHISFLWYCHDRLWDRVLCLPRPATNDNLNHHRMVANFIAVHDVIQLPREPHGTSEDASAAWFAFAATFDETHLISPETNISKMTWTCDVIRASANHFADLPAYPLDTDEGMLAQWCLGLDLIPLAAPPTIFDQNAHMLRAEYSHLSDDEWAIGRRNFFDKVEAADVIYRHPVLRALFETAAQANVQRALTR